MSNFEQFARVAVLLETFLQIAKAIGGKIWNLDFKTESLHGYQWQDSNAKKPLALEIFVNPVRFQCRARFELIFKIK